MISETNAKGGNDQDVHFRMSKNPEEVHPKHCGTSGLRVKEVSAEIAIDAEHDLRRRQRADTTRNHSAP